MLKGNNHPDGTIKQKRKFFFLRLSTFLILTIVLDFTVGNTLQQLFFRQKSGLNYNTTIAMEKTKAEIIVFGTSRANHHYMPGPFESELHKTFFNAGRDGASIYFADAVLRSLSMRIKPQVVILDIVSGWLLTDASSYERLSVLLPYYNRHPEIHGIIELRSQYEPLKLLSQIYAYNSTLLPILFRNIEPTGKKNQAEKGYVALHTTYSGNFQQLDFENMNYILDQKKIQYFVELLIHNKQVEFY
jgi:hypothetical protein